MPPVVDFERTPAVSAFVLGKFAELYPGSSPAWLKRRFDDTDATFAGRGPFLPVDLPYHSLPHTWMVAVCMALLLEGMCKTPGGPRPTARDFELALAAVLLHDSGYLKEPSDPTGTGAKYTATHIPRSCTYAASYLPTVGVAGYELEDILAAILCTGPHSDISQLAFHGHLGRVIGCALATADYVAQLADPQYPQKLGALYLEFSEADAHNGVPAAKRMFKSEEDLVRRTPGFWTHFVLPKLEKDFQGVYRYLERPPGSGSNGYMDAIAANVATIERHIRAMGP